jgi:cell division protein FtsQ
MNSSQIRQKIYGVIAQARRLGQVLPSVVAVSLVFAGALTVLVSITTQPLERVVIVGEIGELHRSALQGWLVENVAETAANWELDQTETLLETLPWIQSAAATRVWPNTMRIEVKPHIPVALWGDGSFLNSEGQVFEPVPGSEGLVLPKLSGDLNQQSQLMDLYLQLSGLLGKQSALRLDSLSMDSLGQLSVLMEFGMSVKLGRHAQLTRFQRFLDWHERYGASNPIAVSVDVRYRNALAVSEPGQINVLSGIASRSGRGY